MAHKLQVKSVAEGVETRQDYDMLKSVGCDTIQGYFIAKPMDITAFNDFIENYTFKTTSRSLPVVQNQSKINVLVVDDNDFTRKIVLRVLNSLGLTSITDAGSAESALKLLEANTYDLIITDVHMPGLNGLEFAQLIRAGKTHAKPDTRIMVLTQFSQTEVLGTALALDVNGFLVKPIIPSVAEEKLTQAMSEPLRIHPPLAYEAIKTELRSLSNSDNRPPNIHGNKAIVVEKHEEHNDNNEDNDDKNGNVSNHTIRSLRPGMKLNEDIYLSDGSLLMSAGHTLSQLSINRLNK